MPLAPSLRAVGVAIQYFLDGRVVTLLAMTTQNESFKFLWAIIVCYSIMNTHNTNKKKIMRALSVEECKEVSGGGAFSFLKGTGSALAFGVVGFFIGGPAGAVMSLSAWGVNSATDFMYDKMTENRDDQRIENYDAFGNRK